MAAFVKAVELNATGIETDVQMSKDGRLVLIHDESLKRTAGLDQLVVDLDYEEIRKLDAGSWFHPQFAGEHVPLAEELLELGRDNDLVINIELKNGIIKYPHMEERLVELVRDFNMTEQVIFSSFNHYSLLKCKTLAPEIRTGILYVEALHRPWDYAASIHADALHAARYAVTPDWVEEARASGIVYHPWTVNEKHEMIRLLDAGVAGIITDYPDKLNQAIEERRGD